MYFPGFEEEGKLVRKPFSLALDITTTPSDVQDELLDMKNYPAAKDFYEENLNAFWCSIYQSYPKVSEIAIKLLLPFSSTFSRESGFSRMRAETELMWIRNEMCN